MVTRLRHTRHRGYALAREEDQITAWLIVRCVRDQNPVAIGPPATT